MSEHDRPAADAREHPLVVGTRLRREALDVRQGRAVDVQDTVELDLRLQRAEPSLLGAVARLALAQRLDHLGPVERRLAGPALAVPADPRRLRQRAQAL